MSAGDSRGEVARSARRFLARGASARKCVRKELKNGIDEERLEALWREYHGRGLVVAGISVDRGAPRALLDPYVRSLSLTFPILLDPDAAVAGAWRVTALPLSP